MISKFNFLSYKDYNMMNIIMEYINNHPYTLTKFLIEDVYFIIDQFINFFKIKYLNIEFSIITNNGHDLILEFKNNITREIFNMKISNLIRKLKLEKINNIILL